MSIIFCSLNKDWCNEIAKLFPDQTVVCGDIQTIKRGRTLFVSPANCLGFMDGGIDKIYSLKMFKGCQQLIQQKIKEIGLRTCLGRYYLPIGSALIVSVDTLRSTGLVCAPTMFLPHDVSMTRNAYHSFLAALLAWRKKATIYDTLVVTSHCCGYGKMNEKVSAQQMRDAFDEFCALKSYSHPHDLDPPSFKHEVVLMPSVNDEQPSNYDNREIKEISPDKIIMKV